MPTIKLPAGTTHVLCDDVALKITDALCPDDGIDDEGWSVSYGCCWIKCEQEIEQAARDGMLPVKDLLTRGPLAFMRGNAWKSGVVAIDDLRAYVADRGITVTVEDAPEPQPATLSPAPVVAETTDQRRARWLDWYGKGEHGAVQRVYERELLLNPKADRSFIGKEINRAKKEKAEIKRGGAMFGQLVQDGKRKG